MDKETSEITTPKSARASPKKRKSFSMEKNLEKEKEQKCTDIDSDAEMLSSESKNRANATPKSRRRTAKETMVVQTPKTGVDAQADQLQTPRRSLRKSIKPIQDYEDIVTKKTLRSSKKTEKQSSIEEETGHEDNDSDMPKWTPAKVGRVSQKRKSRKSRKNIDKKHLDDDDDERKIEVDVDVLEVIANDEDENKENVEPQELLRNRKSPKDNDNKGSSIRRSQETCLNVSAEKAKGEAKEVGEKSQILISLTPEEVKTRETNSNKANIPKTEYHQQQTESQELLELGLNPIEVDEPMVFPVVSEKCKEEEESKSEIKLKIGEGVEENLIALSPSLVEVNVEPVNVEILQQNNPEPTVPENVPNKAEVNEILDANECELLPEHSGNDKNDINNTPKDANTTLNTSDCIIISPEIGYIKPLAMNKPIEMAQSVESSMPSLVVSDDEQETIDGKGDSCASSGEIPKLLINSVEHVPLTPQKNSTVKTNIVAPIVASSCTPKRMSKTKPYRFPTPYRSRHPPNTKFQVNSKDDAIEIISDEEISSSALQPVVLKLTKMDPKEIVLRSIRKRSLSVCDDRPPKKQFNRVTFNSPANQTAVIEDIDLLISRSAKKGVGYAQTNTVVSDTSNVTKRRKRSLSVDESLMLARLKRHQAPLTPNKSNNTPLKLQPRTKIPNFAAIHQRQFNKMENLLDHVTRKAERAKVLTTSASKLRGMSAQKHGSSNNQNIEPAGSAVGGQNNAETTYARVGKPKALKKIDLSDNANKPALLLATKKSDDCEKNKDEEDVEKSTVINLPNLQLVKKVVLVHPMPSGKKLQNIQAKKIDKPSQPIQIPQVKPAFNLSTTIKKQTANSSMLDRTTTMTSSSSSFIKQSTCVNTKTRAPTQSLADKVASRRQRHMEMYKGRSGDKASRDKDKSIEIIRGVRSNRRFDLQMQHRKNLNHDQI